MKSLLLHCLLLISVAVSAQNYRLIPSGVNCYINNAGTIRAINLDAGAAIGADTVYQNFMVIGEDSSCTASSCSNPWAAYGYSISAPSWMGQVYVIANNGIEYFLNKDGDTLFFYTRSGLNDSWHFYNYPSGDYIEASITRMAIDSVLGTMDSVKYISLQAKNDLGQPISNNYNGLVFRLSKNKGLLDFLSIKDAPVDTVLYKATNVRPLTRGQVYNFDIGDIIQIDEHTNILGTGDFHVFVTLKCVAKTLLGQTGVTYSFNVSAYNQQTESTTTDYTTVSYGNLDLPVYEALPEQGFETPYLMNYRLTKTPTRYNGRTYIYSAAFFDNESSYTLGGCHYSGCVLDGPYESHAYVEGLGELHNEGSGPAGGIFRDFVYYKKGTEEWGTLFTGIKDVKTNTLHVTLSPNPANNKVEYHCNLNNSQPVIIHITDIAGRVLLVQETTAADVISVNTSTLPCGLYLYRVASGDSYVNGKLMIAR